MVSKEEEIYYMEIIIESSIYKKISIIDESDCSKEEKDRLKQEVIDKFVEESKKRCIFLTEDEIRDQVDIVMERIRRTKKKIVNNKTQEGNEYEK